MRYLILPLSLIFFIISCSKKQEEPVPEIKILSKEESDKILNNPKNAKKEKPKLKIKKQKEIVIKTDKGKKLKIGSNTYQKIQENLKRKEKKEKEKLKETLGNLEFLEYKKSVMDALQKDNRNSILNKEAQVHIIDKIRAVFKPVVNKYSLRNLNFKNQGDIVYIDTITLSYLNEDQKKKIDLEIIPLNYKIAEYIKKGQKGFVFKEFKLGDIDLYLSVNYKFRIINATFNKQGYTWVINSKNIIDYNDIFDIIRNINFNTFMELKLKYEKE